MHQRTLRSPSGRLLSSRARLRLVGAAALLATSAAAAIAAFSGNVQAPDPAAPAVRIGGVVATQTMLETQLSPDIDGIRRRTGDPAARQALLRQRVDAYLDDVALASRALERGYGDRPEPAQALEGILRFSVVDPQTGLLAEHLRRRAAVTDADLEQAWAWSRRRYVLDVVRAERPEALQTWLQDSAHPPRIEDLAARAADADAGIRIDRDVLDGWPMDWLIDVQDRILASDGTAPATPIVSADGRTVVFVKAVKPYPGAALEDMRAQLRATLIRARVAADFARLRREALEPARIAYDEANLRAVFERVRLTRDPAWIERERPLFADIGAKTLMSYDAGGARRAVTVDAFVEFYASRILRMSLTHPRVLREQLEAMVIEPHLHRTATRLGLLETAHYRALRENYRIKALSNAYVQAEIVAGATVAESSVADYYRRHPEHFRRPGTLDVSWFAFDTYRHARDAQDWIFSRMQPANGAAPRSADATAAGLHEHRLHLRTTLDAGALPDAVLGQAVVMQDGTLSEPIRVGDRYYTVFRHGQSGASQTVPYALAHDPLREQLQDAAVADALAAVLADIRRTTPISIAIDPRRLERALGRDDG